MNARSQDIESHEQNKVLPQDNGELSDSQLEKVAAGTASVCRPPRIDGLEAKRQ